jgi:hypothetical protein
MNGAALAGQRKFVIQPVEEGETITRRLIADVVSEARKGVDRHELRADVFGQKPRSDGKIFVTGLSREGVAGPK